MPRKTKSFGNWLDKKGAPSPPASLLASEEEKAQYLVESSLYNMNVTFELCKHYKINGEYKGDIENLWLELALNLARDFVPAMQVPKSPGSKKEWGWVELCCLDILVERAKTKQKENPDLPYSSPYNQELIEEAKNTRLKELVEKNNVTPKTLQNKHLDFIKSPQKPLIDTLLSSLDQCTIEEKEKCLDNILKRKI